MKKCTSTFPLSRRTLLSKFAASTTMGFFHSSRLLAATEQLNMPATPASAPEALASDEQWWAEVASFYDRTEGIVNLEHGYWGKMANPVKDYYLAATEMVNQQNSWYARKAYGEDLQLSTSAVADALGVAPDEITLTRNASEAIQNLIRQYQGLKEGDKVLYADTDYPAFKNSMQWLEQGRGATLVELQIPVRANQTELLASYVETFDKHPELKLILLTHVSNQHGLVFPVREIAAAAKARGIDVICDAAQSWGLLDYKLDELGVDWAGFNLHKWIGSPVGVGALYMRKGTLEPIAPFPGEQDPDNTRMASRIHTATANFAAMITVPAALEFHRAVGGAAKEARLKYLRSLWTEPAEQMPHIEVLGATNSGSGTGMGAFRLKGQPDLERNTALQKRLESEFGIFSVVRVGLVGGACIRITPQVFTHKDEIDVFIKALEQLV